MSFPRLAVLALPLVLLLPALTGGCAAPVAVAAVSYGADGASLIGTGKTSSDHFLSMVAKRDCALWRIFRNRDICRAQEGNPNPYDVNYDAPFRQAGEGGVEYAAAPHSPADAPAVSWDSAAYKTTAEHQVAERPPTPATVKTETLPEVAQPEPPPPPVAQAAPVKTPPEKVGHSTPKKKKKPVKKPAPDSAAPSP
jgi:hypothetical protein